MQRYNDYLSCMLLRRKQFSIQETFVFYLYSFEIEVIQKVRYNFIKISKVVKLFAKVYQEN